MIKSNKSWPKRQAQSTGKWAKLKSYRRNTAHNEWRERSNYRTRQIELSLFKLRSQIMTIKANFISHFSRAFPNPTQPQQLLCNFSENVGTSSCSEFAPQEGLGVDQRFCDRCKLPLFRHWMLASGHGFEPCYPGGSSPSSGGL